MRSNLQGLNLKMQTMKTSHEMAQAMGKMSKAMKAMNKAMNVPKMQELMTEFQRQEMALGMTQEMMDDVVDDVLSDPTSAESEDALVKQVLDEIGVNLTQSLQEAPLAPVKTAVQSSEPVALDSNVSDLEARLENLRRDG
jgi:charged multivesicular body protein 2A